MAAFFNEEDPEGVRTARVLRRTYDMLLDGQHTGRYKWSQLHKTEKTHFGTLVEINLQREFGFEDGVSMDFAIQGIDVDCKFSQKLGDWMIPPEAAGHLLLGLWASDQEGKWSAGLIRAREDVLSASQGNRDRKRWLSKAGKQAVHWIYWNQPLPENALLHIPPQHVDKIFSYSSGSKRVDTLFRLAQGRPISRNVVATVAQQDDYMKRIRGNGGSRSNLRPGGIVIFGQYTSHRRIAEALGLPVPGAGESVSARLARRASQHGDAPFALLEGQQWVVALPSDPVEPAPQLPDTRRKDTGG
ncbi:NaeI family type II restriction endonuclease [Actinoallomurus acanthiterrae]